MNKTKQIFTIFLLFFLTKTISQTVFHTEEISNFYEAFDMVQKTPDKTQHADIVQKIYFDKGTFGITYLLDNSVENRKATAQDWADMMTNNAAKIIQIRPYFNNLSSQKTILEQKFKYFKALYPKFKDGDVYFVIGLGMFGGRPTTDNKLIIGCELMAKPTDDWAVSIVLHEYVHTLQKLTANALLAQSINEGAADFIAEIVNQKSLRESYPNGYIDFGYQNEAAVWSDFKKYISSSEKGQYFDWLYGQKGRNINGEQMKDLGYFMGYKICQSYYENAADKKQAIKEIIELDLSTNENAKNFLLKSGYAPKKDQKFVKKLRFSKLSLSKKKVKLVVLGYTMNKENITFQFELPKSYDRSKLKFVTVAGNFNGWNPKDFNYKLMPKTDIIFELTLPLSAFSAKQNQFKFVINGDNWQNVPENAKNTADGNLTFEIK
jgi:hypothetical protein